MLFQFMKFSKFLFIRRYSCISHSSENSLVDNFNRFHKYLRISLTERCSLRCLYCMPEDGVNLTPKHEILTAEEIFKLSSVFVKLGIQKIRLTGGEPLVRKDVVEIIEKLNILKERGLISISMTTNGITLSSKIDHLIRAGLDSVNISLDTLKPDKFELITRRKGHERVWKSIMDCLDKDLKSVKVNCVVIRGINDEEICDFVNLTKTLPIDIRFIEYMPFGGNKWELKKMVSYAEMLARITDDNKQLLPVDNGLNSTSKMFRIPSWVGRVGFITSNTVNFCKTCNRLRLTADGNLKVCLHDMEEVSLRNPLRSGISDENLTSIINNAVKRKKAGHAENTKTLSHVNSQGKMVMVDISDKPPSDRESCASCFIQMHPETVNRIRENTIEKGDVLTVAKIAGIQAAKKTYELIPLCHQLQLTKIDISCDMRENGIQVICRVTGSGQKTGVEMECLIGATISAITIFDMCKAIDHQMIINSVQVEYKTGGKSNYFRNK